MSKKLLTLPQIKIKPRTENQKRFIEAFNFSDFVLLESLPGCGKTYISVGLAAQALSLQKASKVVICQATNHTSKTMGYTSGSFREKCLDYFEQHIEYFHTFFGDTTTFEKLWEERVIEITATELLRGRNFENTIMILDEAQNCSRHDILTFVTRMSVGSKIIICGDRNQIDSTQICFFAKMMDSLEDENIRKVLFTEEDICRHNLMGRIYLKMTKL